MTTYFAKAIHSVPWDAQEGPHGVPHAGCQIGGDHTTGGPSPLTTHQESMEPEHVGPWRSLAA